MKSTKRYYLFFYIDIVISGQNYNKLDISKTLNASSKLVPKILCFPAADLTSYNIEPSIRVPQNPCACSVVSRVFKCVYDVVGPPAKFMYLDGSKYGSTLV